MNRIAFSTLIFFIPLVMFSCGSPRQGNPVVSSVQDSLAKGPAKPPCLNLADLTGKTREVLLSQIATGVTYVPLETTNDFLIGEKNVHVKPCGEYLFVSEHGKPVGVFDRNGKFIRKIGNIGKGPGEYNFDFNFWPEESSRQIFLWNADKRTIMAFSFEGAFVKDIVPEINPQSFAPLGKGRFFTWTFMQKEEDGKFFRMVFHDDAGKTISRVFEPKIKYDFSMGIAIMSPLLTPAPDGFLYNSWEQDTIFKARPDGSFEPAFIWITGKYRIPFSGLREYARYMREKQNYILDFNAFEGSSAWLIRYDYKNRREMAICEKRTWEYYVVSNPDTAQQGIFNDIDGGPSFFPGWDNEKGHSFVRLINAIDLIGYQKETAGTKLPVKDPAAAKRFRDLVAGLNENSNPVVMLVTL
jgi:hypothetical protein